jgi:hypothetical protein
VDEEENDPVWEFTVKKSHLKSLKNEEKFFLIGTNPDANIITRSE